MQALHGETGLYTFGMNGLSNDAVQAEPPKRVDAALFKELDLNLLRVFDAAMAERNLTRAAMALDMSQPAVSNALRRLREWLNDELLVRAGFGVRPTERALALWPAVRVALEGLRAVFEPPSFDAARSHDSFVVAMSDATAALLVPPLIETLGQVAPGVSLRLRPLLARDPRALLARGELDLAVGYFPAAVAAIGAAATQDATAEPFETERVHDGRYVCGLRPGHPLAQQTLDLDAFCAARHVLVSFSGRPFGFVDEALAAMGRSRRVVLTVNQFSTASQVVARSDLLTVVPEGFIESAGLSGQLRERPLPLVLAPIQVDQMWHQRNTGRPSHAWLRRMLREAACEVLAPASPPVLDDDFCF